MAINQAEGQAQEMATTMITTAGYERVAAGSRAQAVAVAVARHAGGSSTFSRKARNQDIYDVLVSWPVEVPVCDLADEPTVGAGWAACSGWGYEQVEGLTICLPHYRAFFPMSK